MPPSPASRVLVSVALVVLLSSCVPHAVRGQPVSDGLDPEAMALLCNVTRAWAPNDPELATLGCSPDIAPLPPDRQPCALRAPGDEPRSLRFDATGHVSEATSAIVFSGGSLPVVIGFENDARGILAIHGSNVDATVRREEGAVTLVSAGDDVEHTETRFESGSTGVIVVESALVGSGFHDVSVRWESTVSGRIRTSRNERGERAELEWDERGRPIRFATFHEGGTHEVRYTWNDGGQLTAQTPHGGFVNPTEILYRCDEPSR